MMNWSASLDGRLLALGNVTAAAAAATLSAESGLTITEDAARNRRRRLLRTEQNATAAVESPAHESLPLVEGFIGLRVVYADIEATDLGAMFGHLLCCSFADEWGNVDTYRRDSDELRGKNLIDDGPLAVAIRDRLEQYDIIVGHNFRLYDRPFINARLVKAGARVLRQDLKYVDTLFLAGGQNLRLGSRKLDNIAKFLKLPVQKTPLDGDIWQLADSGDPDAFNAVVEHCEHDVLVERQVFAYLKQFVSVIHR